MDTATALLFFDLGKRCKPSWIIREKCYKTNVKGGESNVMEIKSGNDYRKHPALSRVAAVDNWTFGKKIVFGKGNAGAVEQTFQDFLD